MTRPPPGPGIGDPEELPIEDPRETPPAPEPEPETKSKSRKGLFVLLAVFAIAVLAVAAALPYLDRLKEVAGIGGGEENACSEAAFAADRESDPAARLERVRTCAGVAGVSPETRLGVVEGLLDQYPDARVVMGRWYDPAHHESDHSPFDAPSIETAARYYSEAKEAGAADADALLGDACGRLDADDLMQSNAIHLYCPAR